MKTQKEIHIIITGFGGQGIVLAGDILGKAASIYDHKFATMTQNYVTGGARRRSFQSGHYQSRRNSFPLRRKSGDSGSA